MQVGTQTQISKLNKDEYWLKAKLVDSGCWHLNYDNLCFLS